MSAVGRLGEFANGSFGAVQFAETGFGWPLSVNRYGHLGHGVRIHRGWKQPFAEPLHWPAGIRPIADRHGPATERWQWPMSHLLLGAIYRQS